MLIYSGEGAFILDPQIGHDGYHIHVGFTATYEGGSYFNRYGRTNKFPLGQNDIFDSIWHGPSIAVRTTDNATARPVTKIVPVYCLRPAPPTKKEVDVIVVRDGPYYGKRGNVVKYSRKQKEALVRLDTDQNVQTFPEKDVCVISTIDLI